MVRRIYVEKKAALILLRKKRWRILKARWANPALLGVRILIRYDIEGLDRGAFSTPPCARCSPSPPWIPYIMARLKNPRVRSLRGGIPARPVRPARGQRGAVRRTCAASARAPAYAARRSTRSARRTEADAEDIKKYVINPVDSREASERFARNAGGNAARAGGRAGAGGLYVRWTTRAFPKWFHAYGLAMSFEDLKFVQEPTFKDDERRDPTLAELRVIDTYWSDHCRHTTFLTKLDRKVSFDEDAQDASAYTKNTSKRAKPSMATGKRISA